MTTRPSSIRQPRPCRALPVCGIRSAAAEPETNEPLADGRESYTANFYYNRNSYTLTAQNYDEIIQYNDVLYQADLDRRMYDLLLMPYPKPLEKYAYELGRLVHLPRLLPGQ